MNNNTSSFKDQFTIIPIMVGVLSLEREAEFGQILAPYLADPQNLFVISSDFCHWGNRFRYTHYDESEGPIYKSIEKLDKEVFERTNLFKTKGVLLIKCKSLCCIREWILLRNWIPSHLPSTYESFKTQFAAVIRLEFSCRFDYYTNSFYKIP